MRHACLKIMSLRIAILDGRRAAILLMKRTRGHACCNCHASAECRPRWVKCSASGERAPSRAACKRLSPAWHHTASPPAVHVLYPSTAGPKNPASQLPSQSDAKIDQLALLLCEMKIRLACACHCTAVLLSQEALSSPFSA